MPDQEKILRTAFVVGAVTDALAIAPMIVPGFAKLLWGFEDRSGAYQFAMGYGASLMLGWTVLLAWAYQSPLERRFVAALTVLVIYGLVLTEVIAVASGHLQAWRMLPTWGLQMVRHRSRVILGRSVPARSSGYKPALQRSVVIAPGEHCEEMPPRDAPVFWRRGRAGARPVQAPGPRGT